MGIILAVFALIGPTLSSNILRFLSILVFVLFLFFGYYLVKATHEEERRRQEAEKLAKEWKSLAQSKDQFMLSVQHHLRTPMTAMKGYLEGLIEGAYGKFPEPSHEKLLHTQQATNILYHTIEELIELQMFRLGKGALLIEDVDLKKLIESVINELILQIKEKNLNLKTSLFSLTIKADRKRLREIFFVILDNAIKYTNEGKIEIKMEIISENKVLISFKDSGIGMEKEEIDRILQGDIFVRGEEAKRYFATGKGIGLALALEFIKAHQGNLKIESEGKGKGTKLSVILPIK